MLGLFLSMLLSTALSLVGVDMGLGNYSADTFKCLKDAGYDFVIVKAYNPDGTYVQLTNQYLTWAKELGFRTQIQMYSCRRINATTQVNEVLSKVNKSLYDRMWVRIENNPGLIEGCQWYHYDTNSNCQYAKELVAQANSSGKPTGIFSSVLAWSTLFNSRANCPYFTAYDLWYATYDKNPSLTNFTPFGGWGKPSMKQFDGNLLVCDVYTLMIITRQYYYNQTRRV